jgi:hypothetical protein
MFNYVAIKLKRLQLAGQVQLPLDRIPKKALRVISTSKQPVGKPRKRWEQTAYSKAWKNLIVQHLIINLNHINLIVLIKM